MKSVFKLSVAIIFLLVNPAIAKAPKWMVGAASLEYTLYIDVNNIVVENDFTASVVARKIIDTYYEIHPLEKE